MAGKRSFLIFIALISLSLSDLFSQAAIITGWRHPDYVYCSTEGGDSLLGASPSGKPFFFDDVSYVFSNVLVRTADGRAIFYPDRASPGNHTIKYGSIGSNEVIVIVTIKDKPTVTLSAFASVCSNAPSYSLFNSDSSNVSPKNGRFSGPGVNGTGVFNPAVAGPGVHSIVYTAGVGSCLSSITRTITVVAAPATGINPFPPVCEGSAPLVLNQGYPAGGTYAGPGIVAGRFDPMVTGIGTFPVTYNYSNGTCTNSATQNIIVPARPVVSFSGLGPQYCTDNAGISLTGNPAGITGEFSGNGITDNGNGTALFEPVNAGLGLHEIQYIYTTAEGCSDTSLQQVQVGTNVTISGLSVNYCINGTDVPFSVLPVGGTFTATAGLTDNGNGSAIFSPSAAGIGLHNITYTFIDGNGCINTRSMPVNVHALPIPAINNLAAAYCVNNPIVVIRGNFAPAGIFSGASITDNSDGTATFNPSGLIPGGPYDILYNYKDPLTGCQATITNQVTINPLPKAILSGNTEICHGNPASLSVALSGSGPFSFTLSDGTGTYTVNDAAGPVANTQVFPADTVTYTITGVTDSKGCSNNGNGIALIKVLPEVVIVSQPASQNACPGSNVIFRVSATGVNLRYQWEKNGAAIAGATSAAIALNNVQPVDIGTYRCTISGDCGIPVISDEALLGLWAPVQLGPDPAGVYECEGSNADLRVQATGSNLTWQWYKNNTAIADGMGYSGATGGNLFISPLMAAHAGNYHVTVSNICGAVTSGEAVVKVDRVVVINNHPQDVSACEGFNAVFTVTATGDNMSYQWQMNNADIPGETSSVLSIAGCTPADQGFYRCVVKSGCGSEITTNAAQLTVSLKPSISSNPVSILRCEGDNAVFSIAATGSLISYQWKKDGVNLADNARITGSMNPVLTIKNVSGNDIGNYSCVVSGPCEVSVSSAAALSVDTSLLITSQPADIQQCLNTNAFFSVSVTGNNLTYQWLKNNIAMAGQTGAVLVINNITISDEAQYICRISNSCGRTISTNPANLIVSRDVLITGSPVDIEICEGNNAIFKCSATGSGITYQWEYNGAVVMDNGNISGTQSDALLIQSASLINQGVYNCLVTGLCGSERTIPASLVVNEGLNITGQPAPVTVCEGNNAEFRVDATGATHFQWQKDETDIPGKNTAVLSIINVDAADSGVYRCIVFNKCDTLATDGAFLDVRIFPSVILQPVPVTGCEKLHVEFEAGATGSDLSWQWFKDAVLLTDGSRISGSGTHALKIDSALQADAGVYAATITGYCGTINTNPALLTIKQSPVITAQPAPLTVCENQPASFTVAVTGQVTYQWQKNNINIAGQTSPTLNIASASAADAGVYRCMITGNCGNFYTTGALLTINRNISIGQQPAAGVVCESEQAVMQVVADGTNLNYQWQLNGTDLSDGTRISGANTGALIINQADAGDEGIYQCIITGSCGSLNSNTAFLQVSKNTIITGQPQTVHTCNGLTASFEVQASGTGLTYQWQKNNVNIAGAQNPVFTIPAVTTNDSGIYNCIITGSCGQVLTQGARLSVDDPPAVTIQPPAIQQVCEGNLISAVVTSSGTNLSYKWYYNGSMLSDGANISGSGTSSLIINPAAESNEGIYYCEISNTCKRTITNGMQVAINQPVVISEQPVNTDACRGQNVSLHVTASGDGLNYQWQKNNMDIAGATDAVLTLNNVSDADAGTYQCIIGSACGEGISNAALVSVYQPLTINSAPAASISQCEGTILNLKVIVSGDTRYYQWKKNGLIITNGGRISGANSADLLISNVIAADRGMYTCDITGNCNTVTTPVTNVEIKTAPVVVFPPADLSVLNGGNALFSITASGDNLTYQWYYNSAILTDGAGVTGSNSAILTVNNVGAANEGSYNVVITGSCGSVSGNPASLSVLSSSVITGQPQGGTKCEGESISFSVETSGTGHSYQWKKNGNLLSDVVNVSGSKTAELSVAGIVPSDAGSYTCLIDNTENSAAALLYVNRTTTINFTSGADNICEGEGASLFVQAQGESLSYAWFKNGNPLADDAAISGSSASLLTINPADAIHSGSYACRVTGACGTALSDPQVIAVSEPVNIITEPGNSIVCESQPLSLTVSASGSIISWQWYRNGIALIDDSRITGAKTAALNIVNAVKNDEGSYHCVVTGTCNTVFTNLARITVNRSVSVIRQPSAISACENNLAVFSVTTNGVAADFQWQKDGVNLSDNGKITGSNSNLLSINSLQSSDAGTYRCIISNDCNTVLSSPASLTVNNLVVINSEPAGDTICEGSTFSFSLSVTGSALSYTWMKDGTVLSDDVHFSGTSTPILTVNAATFMQSGVYQCFVTGNCNNAVSSFARLTVNKNTVSIAQPLSSMVCEGNNVVLNATATGSGISYQWQKDNVNLTEDLTYSGTQTDVLHIANATTSQAGIYRCIITGTCNSTISNTAQIQVIVPPAVTLQPENAIICEGANLQIITAASGNNLHYSWLFNGSAMGSADTAAQLYIAGVTRAQQGLYYCRISNICGAVNSDPSTVIVNVHAIISTQPSDAFKCRGEQVSFSVTASGENLLYQWQFNGTPVSDGAGMSGSSTRTLVITGVDAVNQGNYRCVITDGCGGTVISNPAYLTVYEPVNITGISSGDTLCSGQSYTISVNASGSNLSYAWFMNGSVLSDGNGLSGTNTTSLHIDNATIIHSGYYTCEITGICGRKLSAPVPVIVRQPVDITIHPVSLNKCAGETAVFSVIASGDSPVYQWMKDGQALTDVPGIDGSTTSVLVLSSATSASSGSYYCVVSNKCGNQNSQAAALIVNEYPAAAGMITGDAVVCQGTGNKIYSVDAISGAVSYKWTLPSGMIVTAGANTRQIEVSFLTNETGGPVYVEGINSCGSGPASPVLSITSRPLPVAYAGENRGICSDKDVLSAFDQGAPVTGVWQSIAGPAVIDQPLSASTMVRGLRYGANKFAWTTTLNGCSASDTVLIYNNHVLVDAGQDTSICNHIYIMNAGVPETGTGRWSIVYGAGYNIDRYNAKTMVSGLAKGMNIFRWSVINDGCVSYDSVIITNNLPTESDAGNDQVLLTDFTSLGGNSPAIGTGEWSLLNGSGIIKDPLNNNTAVTGLGKGKNIFEWMITYRGCVSADTVVINNSVTDTTDAGPNVTLCSNTVKLNAKNPYPGYGEWSVKHGAATFSKNNQYNSYAYNLAPGRNVLIWTQHLNGIASDSVVIVNNMPTIANAGVGVSICVDSVELNANKPYIGRGNWTVVSGSGSFSDDSSNITLVKNLSRGKNTLRWTITNYSCTSSSTVTISNNRPTDAEAGYDITTCEDTVLLNPNVPTFGKGEWSILSGSAKFSGNMAYDLGRDDNRLIYSIQNYGCYSRDTLIVTSHKPTTAKLGPDQSICQDSVQLTANTPVTGSGLWSIQSGSAILTGVSSPVSMAKQITSGENVFRWTITYKECSSFDDVTISNDFVQADAGDDRSYCSDRAILEGNDPGYSKGVWTVIGGSTGAAVLNPSAPNSVIEKLARGANTLRWTISKNACISWDETVITNNNPTRAFAGEDEFLCIDHTQLRANPVTSGTGTWSILSGSGSVADIHDPLSGITSLAAGINVLRWTSENEGCVSTDEVIVSNNLPLNVYAGLDQELCNDSTVLYANPPVNGNGIWSVMQGAASFDDPHIYNTSVKSLGNGPNRLKWTVSSTGCSVSDTMTIINNLPTRAVAGSDFPVCNSTGSLNANTPLYGTGIWTLISGAGDIAQPVSPRTTIYDLALGSNTVQWTITNGNCISLDQLTIINNSPTIADAGESDEVCGESAILYANSPVIGSGYWSVMSGTGNFADSLNYNTTVTSLNFGDNTLRWTTQNGTCLTFDEITITNNLADVYAGEDQVTYEPGALLTGNNPEKGTGQWQLIAGSGKIENPSAFSGNVTDLAAGLNTFEWTIVNGTCTARDQVVINFKIMPKIGFTVSESEGCPGTTIDFINTTQYGTTYRWEMGDGSVTSEINPSHTYPFADRFNVRLTAYGPDNRLVTADTVIVIYNKPVTSFEYAPDTAFVNKPVRFYDGSYGDADNWSWSFGDNEFSNDQNPLHYYRTSGSYDITLIVTSAHGCSDTLTHSIEVAEDGKLVFPNAFTPNLEGPNGGAYSENDHSNDVFHPYHENVAEFHMEIYSRWGVLLFETDDVNTGWDGYYKGQLLSRDVYVWKATGKYVSGSEFLKTGNVLLVK